MGAVRRLADGLRWRRQGAPVDEPVVREVGTIYVCPHGEYALSGWVFQPGRMQQAMHVDDLADRLTARYPTTRQPLPHQCGRCAAGE